MLAQHVMVQMMCGSAARDDCMSSTVDCAYYVGRLIPSLIRHSTAAQPTRVTGFIFQEYGAPSPPAHLTDNSLWAISVQPSLASKFTGPKSPDCHVWMNTGLSKALSKVKDSRRNKKIMNNFWSCRSCFKM